MGRNRRQRRNRDKRGHREQPSKGAPRRVRAEKAQRPPRARAAAPAPDSIVVGKVSARPDPVGGSPVSAGPPTMRIPITFGRRTASLSQAADLPSSVMLGSGGNYYSPQLSTDFLELPQSQEELRLFYQWFYDNHPVVGQAVDLRTEMLLSKVRLKRPGAKSKDLADASMRFCERWADRIHLLERLMEVTHELSLYGDSYVFVEDSTPDMPDDVSSEEVFVPDEAGNLRRALVQRPDARAREVAWLKKNYKGWTAIRTLPADRVNMEAYPLTDLRTFDFSPDERAQELVEKADNGDERAQIVVKSMPPELVEYVRAGEAFPLNTDPYAGSFVAYLSRRRTSYQLRGASVLQRCLRDLVFEDKIRQAQTSIASRHMTPYRIVWADNMSQAQVDDLRDQVDLALQDPDYSIITNFEVHWEERGGGTENRLLELTSEHDRIDRHLYAGLGVTESLLSGEASYSGDRINLEVINWRDMLRREQLQNFIDFQVLEPMCARMGFVEEDEDGNMQTVFPRLSFTRIGIRDHQEVFDALFNLYTKGSLDVETIYDVLGLDGDVIKMRIEKDLFTVNDPTFNELPRGVYAALGQKIADSTDLMDRIVEKLGLSMAKVPDAAQSRFASAKGGKLGRLGRQGLANLVDRLVAEALTKRTTAAPAVS